jgi:saccharopine dehydrogenase-like NADP-dependent oxidoreductase
MQGAAALYDLARSKDVAEVVAADLDIDRVKASSLFKPHRAKVRFERLDAEDGESIDRLMGLRPDAAIDLLPVAFHDAVVSSAVENRVHIVNASYPSEHIKGLSDEAEARDVTVLPEFGMDPGIDLVLMGEAVRSLDTVEEITTYGAGFPEPEAADNPLRYKVTWNLAGVLRSYHRPARIIRNGAVVDIAADEIFSPEHTHEIEIEGVGRLEAFPNGDAAKYPDLLGISRPELRNIGRYVLRRPGHCELWRTLADLGFLDDEPLSVDGVSVNRRHYLAKLLEPRIQYAPGERDVVVVRIEVTGVRADSKTKVVHQVIDRKDLETGITAMGRTVGFTASIGAQMIASGRIAKRGVLSPLGDVPYEAFTRELRKREIEVRSESTACA